MKRILCLLLTACTLLVALPQLIACGDSDTLDYRLFTDTMVYDEINKLSTGELSADGKTIMLKAELGAYYVFSENRFMTVIEKYDATACCAAYYELRFSDAAARPTLGSSIEISGTVHGTGSEGYIEVTECKTVSGAPAASADIDTTAFTSEELTEFLETCSATGNEYIGKTVRICGGYEPERLISYYRTQSGKIYAKKLAVVHSDALELPQVDTGYMNCYEIVGIIEAPRLEISDQKSVWYPCISITQISAVNNYTTDLDQSGGI